MRNWPLVAILVISLSLIAVLLQPATAKDYGVGAEGGGEEPLATAITSCTAINAAGLYELQNDILNSASTACIMITSSNVIFDGMGHTIDGIDVSNSQGVKIYNMAGLTNITIRNVTLTDWGRAIEWMYASNGRIENVAANSNMNGIYMPQAYLCSNNVLRNNIANSNSQSGLYSLCNGGTFTNNVANSNSNYGFYVGGSSNVLNDNTANSNKYGLYISGSSNTLNDNTAIGNTQFDAYASYTSVPYYNLNIGVANVSFVGNGVNVKGTTAPAGNPPMPSLGKYVSLSSAWPGAIISLNISYTDAEVQNAGIINENTLSMARYDGTWYTNPAAFATSYGVDTTNNVVYASITNPSGTYGPLGTSGQITNCTTINSPGEYKLAQDIATSNWFCIRINSNNVILDGQGHTIDGAGYGIAVSRVNPNLQNITVKNLVITDWDSGMWFANVNNIVIENNNIRSCNNYAINLESGVENSVIKNNNLSANPNAFGIWLQFGGHNNITNNIMNSNKYGLQVNSPYNNVINNTANSNLYGMVLSADSAYNNFINNTVKSNTKDGFLFAIGGYSGLNLANNLLTNNIVRQNGQSGIHLYSNDCNAYYPWGRISSLSITDGNDISANTNAGILLDGCYIDHATIKNNNINGNKYGIKSDNSLTGTLFNLKDSVITNNTINSNSEAGLLLSGLNYTIASNNIVGGAKGIELASTANNMLVQSNTLDSATLGMNITGKNNNISGNTIYTPQVYAERNGMVISGAYATGNNINNNKIYTGSCEHNGILIDGANSNILAGNTIDADRVCSGSCGYCGSPAVKKGITVQNANYNILTSNVIQKNLYEAVKLQNASFTTIQGQDSSHGIYQGAIGLSLYSADNNNIIGGNFYGGAAYGYASSGITLSSSNNNNITNAFAAGYRGITMTNSNNNLIKNSIAMGSQQSNYQPPQGIEIVNSVGNTLLDNRLSGYGYNSARLLLSNANNTIVSNLSWYDTGGLQGTYGVKIINSHYNTLEKITLHGVTTAYGTAYGIYAENSNGNTFSNGIIKPWDGGQANYAIYVKNSNDNIIENNVGYPYFNDYFITVYGGQNNIVRGNSLTSGYATYSGHVGLVLTNAINNQIYNNNFTKFCYNVLLSNADGNTFQNNMLGNANTTSLTGPKSCPTPTQAGTGILTKDGSTGNTFTLNNILQNEKKGVWLYESAPISINAVVSNNNIVGTSDSSVGIQKDNVVQTTLTDNTITNCGIAVNASATSQDPISYNTFSDSTIGINFNAVTNSQVDHNTFINVIKPIVLSSTSGNTFDSNTGAGNGIAITGQTAADTFTNNIIGEIPATTVICGQTLTTSTKMANSLSCAGNGLTLSGNNIFLVCNGKTIAGIRNPTTQQLRGTGVIALGSNDMVDGCNITGFALAVDLGANPNVMSNDNLYKNAKGVSFTEYLKQAFLNIDWDP